MNDIIEFKIVNPQNKEEWIEEYSNIDAVAEIYINGTEIIDILKPIEQPYCDEEGHPDIAGSYGHNTPKYLYESLMNAMNKESYESKDGVELLCCGGCGYSGCWSTLVFIRDDEKFVYWEKIEHNHRDWKYNLSYKFEKLAYYRALETLV